VGAKPYCKRRPFPVIEAECGSVVVAEIIFRQVTVQMFLVDATHAALED
jgi:hypothetical protein